MDQDPAAWAPTPGSARLRAQQPGASRNGTWEPVLTTGEFGAIRSAGFEVAGRVSGADVYSLAVVNAGQCPRRHPLWARRCGTFPTEVSSLGFPNASFAPLVAVLYNARRAAIGRMLAVDATAGRPAWAQDPGEQARFSTGSMEDDGITHLVNVTRQEARRELARHAQRLGADGVVLAGQALNLFHLECPSYEGGRDQGEGHRARPSGRG